MKASESNSRTLLWIGGVLLTAGALIYGIWVVSSIASDSDMPLPLLVAFAAVILGLGFLLVAAIRDRMQRSKTEDLGEVDY